MEVEKRRDVRIEGKTVHSMAIHEGMGKLVVSRKNGANFSDDVIEQYSILCGWLCVHEKVICPDNGGIESVCFVGDRILCTHLNGSVTIADPHSDSIRRVQVCPSPLWSSCAVDATHAAFVSHSASLFILDLKDYTVSTPLGLGVDQRLFSVCSQKDVIAIGAMDSVFIVKNNAVARKMVVPRKV
ncbi:hypothetical protein ANCCAN_22387 [Ancylostoma caninum]|uniref:NHL repeat protein n=1 Tax=Ancylostoma caninum TaxID=29170 RepID=A0A368FHY2_ANCCA|nr:hypothetical protein ANCCAN_22387 [Ancylostoma caninum]